jgi:DNA-directed RNA polymerase subunit M/transcription elongation factor TFIIS
MKFCEKCENMYYISIDDQDDNKLTYYCRNCGNKENSFSENGICVLNTQIKKGKQQFHHIINSYTKMDPTLPRIYNYLCPNNECPTNKKDKNNDTKTEIIYMRYDDENMKYVYICTTCDNVWTTNENV